MPSPRQQSAEQEVTHAKPPTADLDGAVIAGPLDDARLNRRHIGKAMCCEVFALTSKPSPRTRGPHCGYRPIRASASLSQCSRRRPRSNHCEQTSIKTGDAHP
jgi:hypothetical protein